MSEVLEKSSSADFTLYPLLRLAVCFALGILTANFLWFGWQIYFALCLLFAVFTVFFIKKSFALIFLSAAFVAAGGLCFQIENQTISPRRLQKLYDAEQIKSGDPIEIEGVLRSSAELAADGFFIEIETEKAIYKNYGNQSFG